MILTEYFRENKLVTFLCVIASISISSCLIQETEYEKEVKRANEALEAFIHENQINATRNLNGFYFERIAENPSGKTINTGDVVSIKYQMKTLRGTLVDETTQDETLMFGHQERALIPSGLNTGVSLMREGEKYRFYIPFYLAFGSFSSSKFFQPYENFIIETEIVKIQNMDAIALSELDSITQYLEVKEIENVEVRNSGLHYYTVKEGTGKQPKAYDVVTFYFGRKYLNGQLIEETPYQQPVTIRLNTGRAVPGLEEGLRQMKEGGISVLIMPSKLAFGASVQVIPPELRPILVGNGIINTRTRPFAPVLYEVELVSVN
ncbi:MAG: FKBP-type peptidyl-prolyl cis-trans isomerase [Cyclobacteriaceae bacterium]|nr:FKBP-type peptidyl-prolyl cis-trans isomerase [Cyclobacteriaceae bacterium]